MKKSAHPLIAELPDRQSRVEMTIGSNRRRGYGRFQACGGSRDRFPMVRFCAALLSGWFHRRCFGFGRNQRVKDQHGFAFHLNADWWVSRFSAAGAPGQVMAPSG